MSGATTYSARYATRQLSISGVRSPPAAATPERRSFLASPATSIHGSPVPQSGKSARANSPLPPLPHPANVLAGAAAALSGHGSHARPSAMEGSGWHMATADGLPFHPKGSLVASSGGSRTLRPITSQQVGIASSTCNSYAVSHCSTGGCYYIRRLESFSTITG